MDARHAERRVLTWLADALRTVGGRFGSTPGPDSRPETSADAARVEVLGREDCMRLLRRADMGRVAFRAGERLMVLPVNCVVVRDAVVLRSSESSSLTRSGECPVTFEIDGVALLGGTSREAWSVVVQGVLRRVVGAELERLAVLPLVEPWAPGMHPAYLRIEPEVVSGRRFVIGSVATGQEQPTGSVAAGQEQPGQERQPA